MIFIRNTTLCLAIVGVITIAALASIATFGIKLSPDFTGGSLVEVSFSEARPSKADVIEKFEALGVESVTAREAGEKSIIVRTAELTPALQGSVTKMVTEDMKATIERMNTVGPVIGTELYKKGLWAIGFVSLAILLYVAWAFRPVGKMKEKKDIANMRKGEPVGVQDASSWWYGTIAIITLAHDIIVPAGAIAVLGYLYGIEADTLFITAILTILGYSVNDTIVIFDRVREKVREYAGKTQHVPSFDTIVGTALTETYGRSINTSLTTVIALAALYIFGPETTKMFALTMGLGVVAGTYSSIALAAPLLALVHKKTKV